MKITNRWSVLFYWNRWLWQPKGTEYLAPRYENSYKYWVFGPFKIRRKGL